MKPLKIYLILALAVVLFCGFFLSGVHAKIVDRVLAVVDNEIITQVELNQAITVYERQIKSANMDDARKQQALAKVRQTMLEQMIDRSLARQEAKKYHIEVSDREVEDIIENLKKQNNLSSVQFLRALREQGMDLDQYKKQIRQEVLQSRLINQVVRSKVIVTDSDVRNYYDTHIREFGKLEEYRLRNILVKSKSLADKIKGQLDEGKDFAELARSYSIYANAQSGGELGTFSVDSFSTEIRAGIENLKKLQYSGVMETANGYQIFFVEDIIPAGGKPFGEVKDQIHEKLYKKASEEKFATWLEGLKKHAHIEIKDIPPVDKIPSKK